MFAGPVMADGIVADGGANPSLRPEIINTQNGLPQVNITAPNQAGVSHNQYQQFDVDTKGAILNNSAVMTSTQMAGMIQGNPNLNPNSAPARVILNEVNSNNPSQLRGFMEVAGGKAQVWPTRRHRLQRLRHHQRRAHDADHRQTATERRWQRGGLPG